MKGIVKLKKDIDKSLKGLGVFNTHIEVGMLNPQLHTHEIQVTGSLIESFGLVESLSTIDAMDYNERVKTIRNTLAELQLQSLEMGYEATNSKKRALKDEIESVIKTLNALND